MLILVRGIARVSSAVAGIVVTWFAAGVVPLLVSLSPKPMAVGSEIALAFLCTAPWMLLYCSGAEDLALAAHRSLLVWLGVLAVIPLLYCCWTFASLSMVTKAALLPLAVGLGILPLFVRRFRFLFVVASVAGGVTGMVLIYFLLMLEVSNPTSDLQPGKLSAAETLPILVFSIALITAGVLSVWDTRRKKNAA